MSQQHNASIIGNSYGYHYKWVLDPIARAAHDASIA
ncbi:hypothetical protein SPRA44_220062 [Serratia proteamaculans]|nr:hypothetical protein SPRA44_220062 [Serratia proteamaculans]